MGSTVVTDDRSSQEPDPLGDTWLSRASTFSILTASSGSSTTRCSSASARRRPSTGTTIRGPGFWNISQHDDLVAVNRDTATFSSEAGGMLILKPDEMPGDGMGNDPRG